MRKQLHQMLLSLQKDRNSLYKLRDTYIAAAYEAASSPEKASKLHKSLYNITINAKEVKSKRLFLYFSKIANKIKKQKMDADGFLFIAYKIIEDSDKIINKEVKDKESKSKEKIIEESSKQAMKDHKVFYVASAHGDSAEDHRPWQGKVYVDANYKSLGDKELNEYVSSHNILTMQWVTSTPVYFITRPHCRHYFVRYGFNDIKTNNYAVPYHTIGPRTKHPPVLEGYFRRQKALQSMSKINKTDSLRQRISKTAELIRKWKKAV